jgi:hypothetical protein
VKTALLAGVAVLLLASSAHAAEKCVNPDGTQDPVCAERNDEDWSSEPRQRVTVVPPLPPGPPPLGWVYCPYTMCGDPPRCSIGVVNVQADGLNVRVAPDGPATMSLVNGTPLIPLQKQGDWLLVAAACDLHQRSHGRGRLVSRSTDVGCISEENTREETTSNRNCRTADGNISKRWTRGRTSRTLGFTGSMANE